MNHRHATGKLALAARRPVQSEAAALVAFIVALQGESLAHRGQLRHVLAVLQPGDAKRSLVGSKQGGHVSRQRAIAGRHA